MTMVCQCPRCGNFEEHVVIDELVKKFRATGNILTIFSGTRYSKVRCKVCNLVHYIRVI